MKTWDLDDPKQFTALRRYFRRNANLGYQYDYSFNPIIRFGYTLYQTRLQSQINDNGFCNSANAYLYVGD